MRKVIVFLSLLGCMGLMGCAPTEFGVPKAQFDKMNHAQQEAVIKQYNQDQAQKAEEAPMVDAIEAAAGKLIGQHEIYKSHTKHTSSSVTVGG